MTTTAAVEIVASWSAPAWATKSINESGSYVDHERWSAVRDGVSACLQQTDAVEIDGTTISMERGPLMVLLHIDRFTVSGLCMLHDEISVEDARQLADVAGVSVEDMQTLRQDVAELLAILDRKVCEHAGSNHSDGLVTVHHGGGPTIVCGFHESQIRDYSNFPRATR